MPTDEIRERYMAIDGADAYIDLAMECLGHADWRVRAFGLWLLTEHGLVVHTAAISGMLTDPSPHVRRAALDALGKHEQLSSHAGAVVGMLSDVVAGVRYDALRVFDSDSMRMLAPDVVALAYNVVTKMLTDEDDLVRREATHALGKLKRERTRRRWGTARAFVHIYLVRPYALFWHAYVGEQLCAPGGKWAERDRAEFENEFIELPK